MNPYPEINSTHIDGLRIVEEHNVINENLNDNDTEVVKQESPKMTELKRLLEKTNQPKLNLRPLLTWLKNNQLENGMRVEVSTKLWALIQGLKKVSLMYSADIFCIFLAMKQLEGVIFWDRCEPLAKSIKSYVNACCYLSDDLIMAEADKIC